MVIIADNEIERIRNSIQDPIKQTGESEKHKLKKISDERVAKWSDTVAARRKARLEWKENRAREEEERRQIIDEKEAELQGKIRKDVIDRAQRLLFEENAEVRHLRSQQLYTDVIEERAKQIRTKKEVKLRAKEEEREWHEETMKHVKLAEEREKQEIEKRKLKSKELALDLQKQRQIAKEVAEERKKEGEAESRRLRKMALEDLVEEQKKSLARKEMIKRANENNVKLVKNMKLRYEENRLVEAEVARKLERETDEMNRLALGRERLEQRMFDERQKARDKLTEKASQDIAIRSAREVELFVLEQQKQVNATAAKDKHEKLLREKKQREIDQSRQEQLRQAEIRKEQERKEAEIFMKHLQHINEKLLKEEQQKERKVCLQNKELRRFHEQQIVDNQKRKQTQKQKELNEHKHVSYLKTFLLYFP